MAQAGSPWAPLRGPLFRAFWLASLISNVGTWMHDVSAGWMMTQLAPSPLMVALMQTATSLPFFLLALPAGALGDVVDRRRVLLVTQTWMLASAAVLGVLTLTGRTTPWILLGLSFSLGLGAAMNGPTLQALTPELVPRAHLAAAVALGGVAVNVARAIGPALGGLLVAAVGTGTVFLLNAISFLAVLGVIARWRRAVVESALPPEHMGDAMQAGARYVRHATEFRAVLMRAAIFVLPASALWALLPLVARLGLGLTALGYGLLLGCLGAGAITSAALLPRIRARVAIDRLIAVGSLVFAGATLLLAILPPPLVAAAGMFVGGMAWMSVMSTISVSSQTAVPAWVRARALAMAMLVIQGGLAGGSLVWGTVATHVGMPAALATAAVLMIAGLRLAARYRLAGTDDLDLTPTRHWAAPIVAGDVAHDRGPVLIVVEYHIDPANAAAFTRAIRSLGRVRRRDGAARWGIFYDAANPSRYIETFLVPSWIEHLRQHERVTAADRELEQVAHSFHLGDGPPHVTHYLAPEDDT